MSKDQDALTQKLFQLTGMTKLIFSATARMRGVATTEIALKVTWLEVTDTGRCIV
jgi:hypothetical protein